MRSTLRSTALNRANVARCGAGCLAIVASVAGIANDLAAQTVVRGRVVDGNRAGLGDAEVFVDPTGSPVTTSAADGSFLLELPGGGVVVIGARKVGFEPEFRRILIANDDTLTVTFSMRATGQVLAPLVVEAPAAAPISAKMREFDERRRAGLGRFLTREMLAKREHSALTDVLRMTAGLQFVRRPAECGGGFAITSGRGGVSKRLEWMRCRTPPQIPFNVACYLAIYLDGTRIWYPGDVEPPNVDNLISVVGLEGVEIYRGPAETPIRYQGTGAACGVLLLWTRTDEHPSRPGLL